MLQWVVLGDSSWCCSGLFLGTLPGAAVGCSWGLFLVLQWVVLGDSSWCCSGLFLGTLPGAAVGCSWVCDFGILITDDVYLGPELH